MHSLQVNVGLDKVSPAPCLSHTLLTKIQTNLRDRLEHTVLLGLCPPQPVSPDILCYFLFHAMIYSVAFLPHLHTLWWGGNSSCCVGINYCLWLYCDKGAESLNLYLCGKVSDFLYLFIPFWKHILHHIYISPCNLNDLQIFQIHRMPLCLFPFFSCCFFSQTLSWSGSHRVNSGEELFYTQSRLSVTGRPHQCSLTFALTNSSTAQGSNMSLFSEVNRPSGEQ